MAPWPKANACWGATAPAARQGAEEAGGKGSRAGSAQKTKPGGGWEKQKRARTLGQMPGSTA